jgi:ribosomal protein S27E
VKAAAIRLVDTKLAAACTGADGFVDPHKLSEGFKTVNNPGTCPKCKSTKTAFVKSATGNAACDACFTAFTADTGKRASSDVLSRVMRGFGVRPLRVTPRQAAFVPSNEMAAWQRAAERYGNEYAMTGDSIDFQLKDITSGGGSLGNDRNTRRNWDKNIEGCPTGRSSLL